MWSRIMSWLLPPRASSVIESDDRQPPLTLYDGDYILCHVWDYLESRDRMSLEAMRILRQAEQDVRDAMKAQEAGR